jgi:hypothetical protein
MIIKRLTLEQSAERRHPGIHLLPTPTPPTPRSCAVHNHGIKSTARGGELVELGHSICGLLAAGYGMNAITGMGNLYAGSKVTPDDVKFVVQTSAAAYCLENVQ